VKAIPLFDLQAQHTPLTAEILNAWKKILHDASFTYGKETEEFQRNFAVFCKTKFALGIRSGTASLIIALKAAGIGPGDEVITTPVTFSASSDAIILTGATPVFVDVLPDTGSIDPAQIPSAITHKTKAILIVHLYGVPCPIKEIQKIAKLHKLILIEDCSHAHGSLYKGKPVGSFGLAGCFSLYPAKTLGSVGNAGVITAQSRKFIKLAEAYAHHGITNHHKKYEHRLVGYNELIDNLQSAVLNLKMKKIAGWIKKKRKIAEQYNKIVKQFDHPGMVWSPDTEPSLYVYALQIKNRSHFERFMKAKNIETGVYYPVPLHLQRSYKFLGYKKGELPQAEKFAQQTIAVPLHPDLSEQEVQYVSDALAEYFVLRSGMLH
jgi:dTDP-4-amino-4,6-dideoxygalactose transaminase